MPSFPAFCCELEIIILVMNNLQLITPSIFSTF